MKAKAFNYNKNTVHRLLNSAGGDQSAFALLATLFIVAAITVLAVSMLSITTTEKKSARAASHQLQAELAIEAGLEDVRNILENSTNNDSYLVLKVPDGVATDANGDGVVSQTEITQSTDLDKKNRSFYYIANWDPGNGTTTTGKWEYQPLYSRNSNEKISTSDSDYSSQIEPITGTADLDFAQLSNPSTSPDASKTDDIKEVKDINVYEQPVDTLPWQAKPRAGWVYINMPQGSDPTNNTETDTQTQVRYSFWVEDLQGYINAEAAGNLGNNDLSHNRFSNPDLIADPTPVTVTEYGALNTGRDSTPSTYTNLFPSVEKNELRKYGFPRWHWVPGMTINNDGGTASKPNTLDKLAMYSVFQNTNSNSDDATASANANSYKVVSKKDRLYTADTIKQRLQDSYELNFENKTTNRDSDGRITVTDDIDEKKFSRWAEESLVYGLEPYWEQQLIPYGMGYHDNYVGKPKRNLNSYFYTYTDPVTNEKSIKGKSTSVADIKKVIDDNLPQFNSNNRYGDFLDDYTTTLAANIIDYADTDSDTTTDDDDNRGTYRGVDSYPLISEVYYSYRAVNYAEGKGKNTNVRKDGRYYYPEYNDSVIKATQSCTDKEKFEGSTVTYFVRMYLELWNPTNQKIKGNIRVGYDFKMSSEDGLFDGGYRLDFDQLKADPDKNNLINDVQILHTAVDKNGGTLKLNDPQLNLSFDVETQEFTVGAEIELLPNEYRCLELGPLEYFLQLGENKTTARENVDKGYNVDEGSCRIADPNSQNFLVWTKPEWDKDEPYNGQSSYKIYWNDKLVDEPKGGIMLRTYDIEPINPFNQKSTRGAMAGFVYGSTVDGVISGHHGGYIPKEVINPGDVFMSYYIKDALASTSYTNNSNWWGRSKKWGVSSDPDLPYNQVNFSKWPDGGFTVTDDDKDTGWNQFIDTTHYGPYKVPGSSVEAYNRPELTAERSNSEEAYTWGDDEEKWHQERTVQYYNYAPFHISNRGRYYSATELGNIHDPIMWQDPGINKDSLANQKWSEITTDFEPYAETDNNNGRWGGGNTLRVGRAEHPRFDQSLTATTHASRFLDLFHAGDPNVDDDIDPSNNSFDQVYLNDNSTEKDGTASLSDGLPAFTASGKRIWGHINLNTASEEAIKAMVTGTLKGGVKNEGLASPLSARFIDTASGDYKDSENGEGYTLAKFIINNRPFTSLSQIAQIEKVDSTIAKRKTDASANYTNKVFGNKDILQNGSSEDWNDRMAEELFARIYNSGTVRSRNFRVYVAGEVVRKSRSGTNTEVLAKSTKMFNVVAKPVRVENSDGTIDPDAVINTAEQMEFKVVLEKNL